MFCFFFQGVASGNIDFREFLRETSHGLHHSVVNKLFGMSQMITVNFFSECFMSRVKGITHCELRVEPKV
jgi:hypothetical protein